MVACQVFLLNRSPHAEELSTGLFERIRSERLLPGLRLNTLHAMQRAVAYLGFCNPPALGAGRRPVRASGGPEQWARWADRWYATSTLNDDADVIVVGLSWVSSRAAGAVPGSRSAGLPEGHRLRQPGFVRVHHSQPAP